MAKNTYGNRVRDANAAYRGAIAQIAGSTTVDHADQFRDYDLAIVDLIAAQDTAFANNDATARLATAQSDLLWKTAQVEARIAAAETAAAAFPSPQTQTPLDNLLDSQPELIEQFEQFYESIQDQVDRTLQETLEGIDLEQSDAITDIGSVHEDETALADGIEPQADTRITPVQPPQATSVRDATGSVFSSRKVRETVVAELPSAHDYGGLIGETGLPGIASTSYVNVHQIHDNGGASLSFEDTFGGFAAGSIAQGAGAIIGVPQSETRTYTYTVSQSPNEETPAEDGETPASDAGTYDLSDSGYQFNNIYAQQISDGPNPTAAEDGDAQETDGHLLTFSNFDFLETKYTGEDLFGLDLDKSNSVIGNQPTTKTDPSGLVEQGKRGQHSKRIDREYYGDGWYRVIGGPDLGNAILEDYCGRAIGGALILPQIYRLQGSRIKDDGTVEGSTRQTRASFLVEYAIATGVPQDGQFHKVTVPEWTNIYSYVERVSINGGLAGAFISTPHTLDAAGTYEIRLDGSLAVGDRILDLATVRNVDFRYRLTDRIDANNAQEYKWDTRGKLDLKRLKNNGAGCMEVILGDFVGDFWLGASYNIQIFFEHQQSWESPAHGE